MPSWSFGNSYIFFSWDGKQNHVTQRLCSDYKSVIMACYEALLMQDSWVLGWLGLTWQKWKCNVNRVEFLARKSSKRPDWCFSNQKGSDCHVYWDWPQPNGSNTPNCVPTLSLPRWLKSMPLKLRAIVGIWLDQKVIPRNSMLDSWTIRCIYWPH